MEQPVVALRRRGDAVPAYTEEKEVDTALLSELLDERKCAFDGSHVSDGAHLWLLQPGSVPYVERPAADREAVLSGGQRTSLSIRGDARDLATCNQVDHRALADTCLSK